MSKKYTPVFPLKKGKFSKQAHVDLPILDGIQTLEEEIGRDGFFGKVSHLYHINPPTGFTKIDGNFKPELLDANVAICGDKNDPYGYDSKIMQNSDIKIRISHRTEPMPFYFRNTLADEVIFVHKGQGQVQTNYGKFDFRQGDYLIFPRGTFYKLIPETTENFFLIIESNSEIQIPDRYILGPNALFDPAIIETPEPNPLPDGGKGIETIARYKRNDEYTHYTFDFDIGRNVVGWKGDLAPWRINIKDFRPIMSHRYHLPPSAHSTFIADNFIICSFVPRLFETEKGAIKIPFYHTNTDYDEFIFYHDGNFFSRDNIEKGMITFHPAGFIHGPHPKALKKMLEQEKDMTDEYAVMIDTKNPLKITEVGKQIINPDYTKSWEGASF